MRLGGEYVEDTLMKSRSECVGKNVREKYEKKSVGAMWSIFCPQKRCLVWSVLWRCQRLAYHRRQKRHIHSWGHSWTFDFGTGWFFVSQHSQITVLAFIFKTFFSSWLFNSNFLVPIFNSLLSILLSSSRGSFKEQITKLQLRLSGLLKLDFKKIDFLLDRLTSIHLSGRQADDGFCCRMSSGGAVCKCVNHPTCWERPLWGYVMLPGAAWTKQRIPGKLRCPVPLQGSSPDRVWEFKII